MSTAASVIALSFRLAAEQVIQKVDSRILTLVPVHSSDPNDPNKSYAMYTPQAEFQFKATNPDVFGALEPGAIYNLVLVREDSGATIEVVAPSLPDDDGTSSQQAGQTGDVAPPATDNPASGVTGGDQRRFSWAGG